MTTAAFPDLSLATRLAEEAIGERAVAAARFTTGSFHYVFEVSFERAAPVVIRLNNEAGRRPMIGAAVLSRRLRPLGVPLPKILAEDLGSPFPYLILERLPGVDLGQVASQLLPARLEGIASRVSQAQALVARSGSAGRYGYAVYASDAPHGCWSEVLRENVERSRRRIAAAGLFDTASADAVASRIEEMSCEFDAMPAVPFLHDTTGKNVIVTATGGFSGIVDVDDLCFGDPRYVVALTQASLLNSGGPPNYIDAWMALSGFEDDRPFRLYVALFLLDFMSEHGQLFNGNEGISTPVERDRLHKLFVAALRAAVLGWRGDDRVNSLDESHRQSSDRVSGTKRDFGRFNTA